MRLCSIDGCDRKHLARGWCGAHYNHWRRYGDPVVVVSVQNPCSIEGCDAAIFARGWCMKHYNRWYKRGNPLTVGTLHGEPLAWLQAQVATRDRSECWEWPFGKDKLGYPRVRFRSTTYLVTHVAMHYDGNPRPVTDNFCLHSCDNPPCVNPAHLRWGSQAENAQDAVSRLRHHHGETHRNAKLKESEVIAILADMREPKLIAKDYGVQREAISKIKNGKRWKHIERVVSGG